MVCDITIYVAFAIRNSRWRRILLSAVPSQRRCGRVSGTLTLWRCGLLLLHPRLGSGGAKFAVEQMMTKRRNELLLRYISSGTFGKREAGEFFRMKR